MRTLSSLLFFVPVVTSLGITGCGSTASGPPAPPGASDPPSSSSELFVSRTSAGLDVVEVDLATGAATSVAGPLPGTTSANVSVRQLTRAGQRLIASTSSAASTDATYATFALDRATHTWRDLGVRSYAPVYSADLGLLVERGPQSQELPNGLKVVTYDGRTLFEAHGAPGADTRYPRLEALSPTGAWFAMRSGADAVDVREIADDGTVGAVRQFPRVEPPDTYSISVTCALPTTMIFAEQYPKATWVDRTLAPVASPSFTGNVDAFPYDLVGSAGSARACSYEVVPGDVHDVYAFGDRQLTKVFSFAGKDNRLIAVGDSVHLRSADAPAYATLARNDGTSSATYTPLPIASLQGGLQASDSVSTIATSLAAPTKAIVFAINHGASEGDYIRTVEIDEELFVVNADGTTKPTLRLRSERDPKAPNAAGYLVPSYRFTHDGSKLVYVLGGRIHVRSIDGDPTADRILDGASFVDVTVRDGGL